MVEEQCHICEQSTDIICDSCGEPVCEDCCVKMTIHNQIDYPLCTSCEDHNNACRAEEDEREWQWQEDKRKKKEAIAAKRRATYLKPENIEKRRLAKIQRRIDKENAERERAQRVVDVMKNMFRGMF